VIRDFHPLIFFYFSGISFSVIGWLLGLFLLYLRLTSGPVAATSTIAAIFLIITGMQSLFFAMWFDMDANKELK
jgi:hypothetical protein